jgi:uncharacterized membrane protein
MNDILRRALKRFIQGVVAYLVTALGTQMVGVDIFDFDVLAGLLVGAVAAGLSASWNGVIDPALSKLKGGGTNQKQ